MVTVVVELPSIGSDCRNCNGGFCVVVGTGGFRMHIIYISIYTCVCHIYIVIYII